MSETFEVPMLGLSLNGELPGKRSFVIQGHIERDCEVKVLNAVLDKMRVAMDRQFAFGALEQLKLQLEQEEKLAANHAARMAQVDENIRVAWTRGNKRGDPVLSAKERQDQQQAYAHAEECKKRIAAVKKNIAECEAIIGA